MVLFELLSREITAAAILRNARRQDPELCELYAHKARLSARFILKGRKRCLPLRLLDIKLQGAWMRVSGPVPPAFAGACMERP